MKKDIRYKPCVIQTRPLSPLVSGERNVLAGLGYAWLCRPFGAWASAAITNISNIFKR